VSSLSQLLLTARDALSAQSFGLGVTGQNISNVNTPAYARRTALLAPRGSGATGVVAVGVSRAADPFLERRWLVDSSAASRSSEKERLLGSVETLFSDAGGTGLGGALDQLFSSFAALSADPTDPTARQTVLNRAETFALQIRERADALAAQRDELLRRARDTVTEINVKSAKIAELNLQIAAVESQGGDASDLIDQRTQLLLGLSQLIDVHTFTDGRNGLAVQAAGTTLVEGGTAHEVGVDLDTNGDLEIVSASGGPPFANLTAHLSGGTLAAIREVRDVDVADAAAQLDRLAWDLGTALNGQHAAGFGLDGVSGRPLFSLSAAVAGAARSIALDSALVGHPERVAASATASGLPGDSENATKLGQIADEDVATGGTRTPSEAWSDLVGDIGRRVEHAKQDAQLRADMKAQSEAQRESTSGVSLDEEMVHMIRYQHAYDAAAKLLATVDELLRELLDRVGR
jgi:flagellar hook-associated protein 1 FlgK